jgi:hypothetical protein
MQGERLAERRVGRSLLLPVLATWECCVSQMKILGNVYDFLISWKLSLFSRHRCHRHYVIDTAGGLGMNDDEPLPWQWCYQCYST